MMPLKQTNKIAAARRKFYDVPKLITALVFYSEAKEFTILIKIPLIIRQIYYTRGRFMSEVIKPVIIPGGLDNLALPDPDLLNTYIDLDNRTVWISDEINMFTLNVIQYIIYWNRADKDIPIEERKPIKLLFYTQGGMLDVYNSIADVIELSQTPVYGINMGACASAGAFIFLSCHKRYMLPNSYFLFHKGSIGFNGNATDVLSLIADYQEQLDTLVESVVAKTDFTEEEMAEKIMSDFYVRAPLAVEKKVVDGIVEDMGILF